MSKFILLAIARSGSTSLAKLLGASDDVDMCIEPFHPDYPKWHPNEPDYSKKIIEVKSLDEAADELFEKFTAIKVLNYQLDAELYKHLMSRQDLKVLLLYRKDILASLLSAEISKQTGAWHKEELTDDSFEKYNELNPLDIDWLKKSYDFISSQNKVFKEFLEKHKAGNYLEIFYEELYSEDMDKNTKAITKICNFLQIEVPDKQSVEKYMLVSNAKLNMTKQYEMIPNYDEIIEAFRSMN